MSGSSKTLIKALDTAFENWDDSCKECETNEDILELFKVVEQVNKRRHTLQIIKNSTNINDELFRTYNKYIEPSHNLAKENIFLEILKQLSPLLTEDETMLWLKTYLKPAVDSAGYDLTFVSKARDFIRKVSIELEVSDDPSLSQMREKTGTQVMDYIINVFMGKGEHCYDIINLNFTVQDSESQEFNERIRFIRQNCATLLLEYGLKRSYDYFDLLNKYIVNPNFRLEIITLLSRLVSLQYPNTRDIIKSELFMNLLKCSFYDYNETSVLVSLYTMVMLLPQIGNLVSPYLPDLLVIYSRLCTWQEVKKFVPNRSKLLSDYLEERNIKWQSLGYDHLFTEFENVHPILSRNKLDMSHFATLLYALYPMNFSKFCQAPFKYLEKNIPRVLEFNLLKMIMSHYSTNDDLPSKELEQVLIDKSKCTIKDFLLHPNFINFDTISLKDELKNPLDWIIKSEDSLGIENIALRCLCLNPSLFVTIPESVFPSNDIEQLKSTSSADSNRSFLISRNQLAYNNDLDLFNNESLTSSAHGSRSSSTSSPMYFNFKDSANKLLLQKPFQEINRKLSVVPTNLVIENKRNAPEVLFKDIKFSEGLSKQKKGDKQNSEGNLASLEEYDGSIPSSPLLRHNSVKYNEPLTELFSSHEKLYGNFKNDGLSELNSESSRKPSGNHHFEKSKSELLIPKTMSSPTTSLETATVHKDSASNVSTLIGTDNASMRNSSSRQKGHIGTVVDFYQRELLLLKNELEFSSYMKHLSKFHYVMLKLEMNKYKREAVTHFQSFENKKNLLMIDNLKASYNSLLESMESTKKDFNNGLHEKMEEIKKLTDQLNHYKTENTHLKRKLESVSNERTLFEEKLDVVFKKAIPERDLEIEHLRIKLESCHNEDEPISVDSFLNEDEPTSAENDVSEKEERIFSMSQELAILNDRNAKLTHLLKEAHELQESTIKSNKANLISTKSESNETIMSFNLQYENKIKELSAIILKYESLLQEKNAKILQLSTSKPIKIPGMKEIKGTGSYNEGGVMDEDQNSSGNSITPTYSNKAQFFQYQGSPGTPSKTNSSTTVPPILKGRGGYQKRSRVKM